jgi:2-polyprenyl-6-methoxyphenol hydroxylase-like FAD-dependent oxidoreductase
VAVAGGGFSGAILARILNSEPGVEVVVFEQSAKTSVRKHWTQPVTGAGLNLNPNALGTLAQIDPELLERLKGIGLPRNKPGVLSNGKPSAQLRLPAGISTSKTWLERSSPPAKGCAFAGTTPTR